MSTEEIQKFIEKNRVSDTNQFKICFKKREPVRGIFVQCKDAYDLQQKNFWRIVSSLKISEWYKTKDLALSRLYSGADFSKIIAEK